ncbi:MAG: HEAT repeat domain-containing protein [Proteobacteria bacterium]|nr:HEAT repeat domain-containing protein [Pseudomonadota bacterium]
MSIINTEEFFNELAFCLNEKDVVKAKALLQFVINSDGDVSVQKKTIVALVNGPEQVVFPLIEYLIQADISDPEIQDALYLLILDKAYSNTDLTVKFIREGEKEARLLFIKAVGELFMTELATELQKIIIERNDKDIVIEAINALGKLRALDALPTIADMAGVPDRDIQKAAVFAIAKSGITDAVDQLMGFIGDDEQTNIVTIEALADIQDLYAIDILANFLSSSDTIIRDTAIDQLLKLGKKSVPILTKSLQNTDEDCLVHLITVLGYIADPAAIIPILDIINTQPKNANIRQAAYEALERIHSPDTAINLVQGLKDPVEAVRMSAARAVNKNFSIPLVAWLRKVIRKGDATSRLVVTALIDSDAANIYEYLVTEETFLKIAHDHIIGKADRETRRAFLRHMSGIGQTEFVKKVSNTVSKKREAANDQTRIIVIDDSKMMLKLLTNKLTAIGFMPKTFDKPEEALPEILNKRPNLIITDLNMPKISGLELSRVVRKKYTQQEVPILMITTQSNFKDEEIEGAGGDGSTLTRTGINKILYKPFTDEEFNNAIMPFLTFN